jgi:hypothetical protein
MMKAAGKMGWTEREFWLCTPSYFFAAYRGHLEQERDRQTENWAQARLVAYYTAAPHLDPKKPFRMTDILRLPGEELQKTVFAPVDPADIEKFNREADEIFARIYQN